MVEGLATGREKPGFLSFGYAGSYVAHGLEYMMTMLLRREQSEAFTRRKLEIYGHAIDETPNLVYEFGRCSRHNLGVYVSPKPILDPQDAYALYHELRSVIGRFQDARAEKEALYVVAAIKLDREIGKLSRLEGRAHQFV